MSVTGITGWARRWASVLLLGTEKNGRPTRTKVKQVGSIENTLQLRTGAVKGGDGRELPGRCGLLEGLLGGEFRLHPGMTDRKGFMSIPLLHMSLLTHNSYRKARGGSNPQCTLYCSQSGALVRLR